VCRLSFDCLRLLAPGQWALHVPLGKLNTERVAPIDDSVCQLVHRLRFFRFLSPVPSDGLLLARRRNRSTLLRDLRTELIQLRTALGIARPIVPHMFRHTFATEMLRSGVSFPALMNLLGHSTPKMTLLYAEFTQTDLQREFRAARSQPRHLVPPARAATSTIGLQPDLTSTLQALQVAQHVLEMFRRTLSNTSGGASQVLDRLSNRLTKIAAELRKLAPK
jgi:Phage integrase family